MDIPASLIIAGIIIIALLTLFVVGVNETLPAFSRNEYDNVCNRYLSLLSIKGKLDIVNRNELINDIENLGFINVQVDVLLEDGTAAPGVIPWGSSVTLKVRSDYVYETIKADGRKEYSTKTATYENSTVVFGLEN